MDTHSESIFRIFVLALIIATACACGKQKPETIKFIGSGSPEKQFVVRVIGIESFTCTFDANSRMIDLTENNQMIEEEAQLAETNIPEYSIK
jgi:hypothetical protein